MLGLCRSLGVGAFGMASVTNCVYLEHTWQNSYCLSCSLTEGWPGPEKPGSPGYWLQGAQNHSRAGQG